MTEGGAWTREVGSWVESIVKGKPTGFAEMMVETAGERGAPGVG